MSKGSKFTSIDTAKVKKTFTKMLDRYRPADQPVGIIDFRYDDFMRESEGYFVSQSTVSLILNHLIVQGIIHREHPGHASRPSRFDVRNLLALNMPEIEVKLVDEPVVTPEITEPAFKATLPEVVALTPVVEEPVNIQSDESEVTIAVVNSTIKEMITYMQDSQREMVHYLGGLANRMHMGDPSVAKLLNEQILELTEQRDKAQAEAEHYKQELAKKPEVTINAHMVVRSLNKILDQTERWISTPGWQRAQKASYFRKSMESLTAEVKEAIGVGAGDGLQ